MLPGGDFQTFQDGGTETEFFAGVKVGIRRRHVGYFAKLRPGFTSFADITSNGTEQHPPAQRSINFALDGGGVFEAYLPKHTLLRIDAGDVTTYFHSVTVSGFPANQAVEPAQSRESLLLLVGAGWRF